MPASPRKPATPASATWPADPRARADALAICRYLEKSKSLGVQRAFTAPLVIESPHGSPRGEADSVLEAPARSLDVPRPLDLIWREVRWRSEHRRRPVARGCARDFRTLTGGIYGPMVRPNVAKSISDGELINGERCS